MTAIKFPPLPPEVRAKLKPFRHTRDRQDEIFDNGGQKATRIRIEREDVVADMIEDPSTETRVVRGEVRAVKRTSQAHRVQSRLERMFKRNEIEEDEYKAGERFALDVEMSSGSVKSCLNNEIGGGDPEMAMIYSSPAAAASRVDAAIRAVGPTIWPLLHWVAIEGRPASEWVEKELDPGAGRNGTAFLRLALKSLVRHYGMDRA